MIPSTNNHATHSEQNKLMARQQLIREYGFSPQAANAELDPEKALGILQEPVQRVSRDPDRFCSYDDCVSFSNDNEN